MNRDFDYSQKVLVAVEFADKPRTLANLPKTHTVFRRIGIPEVVKAFNREVNPLGRLLAGAKFRKVLDLRMGYWEKKIPPGQSCFVHYVRGTQAETDQADQVFRAASNWVTLGIYHIEPQSSAYPFGFPTAPVPDHWFLGDTREFTPKSLFWFNFFPQQKFLFEKTFVIWALFNLFKAKEGGVCNQLVAADHADRVLAQGVDCFVQVNLNRFTSYKGYFSSARAAGKHTFTGDADYLWYGMLLHLA